MKHDSKTENGGQIVTLDKDMLDQVSGGALSLILKPVGCLACGLLGFDPSWITSQVINPAVNPVINQAQFGVR